MMRKALMAVLILSLGIQLEAQNMDLSLIDAVEKAIAFSPELKKIGMNSEKNDYELKSYNSAFLPDVGASVQLGLNPVLPTQRIPNFFGGNPDETIPVQFGTLQSHQAVVQLNQLIYSKAAKTGREVLKKSFELDGLNEELKREQITFQVSKLYFQIQGLQYNRKNLEANMGNLQKLFEVSKARQDAGLGLAIDTDRISINISNLKSQLDILNAQEQSLMDILNILTGIQTGTKLNLVTVDLNAADALPIEEISSFNTVSNELLDLQKDLIALQADATRSQFSPTIAGSVQLGGQLQGNPLEIFIKKDNYSYFGGLGLQVSIPIYNGKKYEYKAKSQMMEAMQIDEDKKLLNQGLQQQYVNAYQTYFANLKQQKEQTDNIALAQRIYQVSQDRYNQGVAPLIDVIDAQKSLTEAENLAMITSLQTKMALIDIMNIQGKITEIIR